MDEYTLMELSWRKGVKNVICHLLAPRKTISLVEVEETRSYMVAIDSGVRYCFTGNPNIIDADSQYVILTDYNTIVYPDGERVHVSDGHHRRLQSFYRGLEPS